MKCLENRVKCQFILYFLILVNPGNFGGRIFHNLFLINLTVRLSPNGNIPVAFLQFQGNHRNIFVSKSRIRLKVVLVVLREEFLLS